MTCNDIRFLSNCFKRSTSYNIQRLTAEGLEGGLLYWGPWVTKRKGLRTGISLHGDSVRRPGVGWSTGDFERWRKGALERGISLHGSAVKGFWRGNPLLGTLEDREKRLWRWASIAIGAPLGNLDVVLGVQRLSLKKPSAEGLWGGLLFWGPRKIC
jgi:hypothetical protein